MQAKPAFLLRAGGIRSLNRKKIKIAIDGPAGAGKSTVARLVARQLDYIYVDTGAMYRAVTWYLQQLGISPSDRERLSASLRNLRIELKPAEEGQEVWVNGREVSGLIRTPAITQEVPLVAQVPEVRELLTQIQKQLSAQGGIIMDGRDIGTTVLPDAELKIFLTASVEERAARRHVELAAAGTNLPLEQLLKDIAQRDRTDQERSVSPLRQADDAVVIDCTNVPIDQVVDRIVALSTSTMNEASAE
jgi:CMP/dCMP kinase